MVSCSFHFFSFIYSKILFFSFGFFKNSMYSINFILLLADQFLSSKKFKISGSCIIFVDVHILLIRLIILFNSKKYGFGKIIVDNSFEFFLKRKEIIFTNCVSVSILRFALLIVIPKKYFFDSG